MTNLRRHPATELQGTEKAEEISRFVKGNGPMMD
jgi:hypothetical protein